MQSSSTVVRYFLFSLRSPGRRRLSFHVMRASNREVKSWMKETRLLPTAVHSHQWQPDRVNPGSYPCVLTSPKPSRFPCENRFSSLAAIKIFHRITRLRKKESRSEQARLSRPSLKNGPRAWMRSWMRSNRSSGYNVRFKLLRLAVVVRYLAFAPCFSKRRATRPPLTPPISKG
jgi:hypothetical protein